MTAAPHVRGVWLANSALLGAFLAMLYVLSWPLVELQLAGKPRSPRDVPVLIKSKSGISAGGVWTTAQIVYNPKWVAVLYGPLRRLREKGEFNPLRLYWEWWEARW